MIPVLQIYFSILFKISESLMIFMAVLRMQMNFSVPGGERKKSRNRPGDLRWGKKKIKLRGFLIGFFQEYGEVLVSL